jgi:hypothetical protein
VFRAFSARSPSLTFWQVGPLSNVRLVAVVAITLVIQFSLLYLPAMRQVFALDHVSPHGVALAALLGLGPVTLVETRKLMAGMRLKRDGDLRNRPVMGNRQDEPSGGFES